MSTDITFVGIGETNIRIDNQFTRVPYVVTEIWVGMSTLKGTLEDFNGPIIEVPTPAEAGSRRFLVTNPVLFVEGLEKWLEAGAPDNYGYDGFNGSLDIVEAIRNYPWLTWWFHVNS